MSDYLADTNILVRLTEGREPLFTTTKQALAKLISEGAHIYITGQNLIEFWNTATRPAKDNGLALTTAEAIEQVNQHRALFDLLPDVPEVLDEWQTLVQRYNVQGVQTHDTRLVAVMLAYNVPNILTYNSKHYKRFADVINVVSPTDV